MEDQKTPEDIQLAKDIEKIVEKGVKVEKVEKVEKTAGSGGEIEKKVVKTEVKESYKGDSTGSSDDVLTINMGKEAKRNKKRDRKKAMMLVKP